MIQLSIKKEMRVLATVIFTIFLFLNCFSQQNDTTRVYDYLKPAESWKIKVYNKNRFEFCTNKLFFKDDVISSGMLKASDSTFQFLCDTSKLKNLDRISKVLKDVSNIPQILIGGQFTKQGNFFIPRNLGYEPDDSLFIPKGMYARYFRGDGFGNIVIEIKPDGTYIFTDHSCTGSRSEEGTWTKQEGVLNFTPSRNKWSMLEWVTLERKLYVTEDFLVGKKLSVVVTKTKRKKVTETFYFLGKMPNYNE